MQGTLLVEFERMLDMKALSIIPVVKDSFYDDRRFEFGKIVCDTLEYGLKYYWCDIEMRVMQFIYMMEDNVDIDIDGYSYEREKKHLYSYSQWCIKDPKQRKNHLKAVPLLAVLCLISEPVTLWEGVIVVMWLVPWPLLCRGGCTGTRSE